MAWRLNNGDVLDEILEVGAISGAVKALPGMPVRKSGRTTADHQYIETVSGLTLPE